MMARLRILQRISSAQLEAAYDEGNFHFVDDKMYEVFSRLLKANNELRQHDCRSELQLGS